VILLDTHVVVWLATEQHRISKSAERAIKEARNSANAVTVSAMTLVEIVSLADKGRVRLHATLESFLQQIETLFLVLPITASICARMATLPVGFPRDLGDRAITATALVHGLSLVTADQEIRRSKIVPTIW
jgi:PIN domain nuclease of toxin-antitoxin system